MQKYKLHKLTGHFNKQTNKCSKQTNKKCVREKKKQTKKQRNKQPHICNASVANVWYLTQPSYFPMSERTHVYRRPYYVTPETIFKSFIQVNNDT